MDKSPQMSEVVDRLAMATFGRTRTEAYKAEICVDCGESAKEFDDELSAKEYTLSGFCQACQDRVFG
jgi:hypothetical protein